MAVKTGKSEFTTENAYNYNRTSTIRWIVSHILRYKLVFIGFVLSFLAAFIVFAYPRILIGQAADEIISPSGGNRLIWLSVGVLVLLTLDGLLSLVGAWLNETIARRFERDAREELYTSLLGKSQAFHDRQRVGDIMARANDDTQALATMISPGLLFLVVDLLMGFIVPIVMLVLVDWQLMFVPILFVVVYTLLVRRYVAKLGPVIGQQRGQFGQLNAGLEETISGIEVVKAASQEIFERFKFRGNARRYRDLFVQQGRIEAMYLPLLAYGIAFGLMFLHCMFLYRADTLGVGDIVAAMSLFGLLRFPTFVSLFAIALVQLGYSSAERILTIINEETNLDENSQGHSAPVTGHIKFEDVAFAYDEKGKVLENVSFEIEPGQTVAIVGQTGSGKSTLTQLVNRTYDATEGRVLVDGVNVAEWNLDALRSQISKIEQDVFLFSRTVAENIAFGADNA
ncbi:MAG: ABC transporter ATP-binding protein, partial [Chloroflexota bacterium]